ncbi:transcriptional regulator [Rathayibacter sp. CAU 1779]
MLADEGYVSILKEPSSSRTDKRRLTWIVLTKAGRTAFAGHVSALEQIANGKDLPPQG